MCERDFTLTCAIRAERGQRGPKACRAPASDGSLAAAMLRATRGPHFGCYHPSVCLVDGRADGRRLQSVPNPRHATCQQAAAPCMAPPHRPCKSRPESATRSADLKMCSSDLCIWPVMFSCPMHIAQKLIYPQQQAGLKALLNPH